jgi:hypothetical protein
MLLWGLWLASPPHFTSQRLLAAPSRDVATAVLGGHDSCIVIAIENVNEA